MKPNPSLQKKTAARVAAVQCLYTLAITGETRTPQQIVAALKKQLEHNRDEQKLVVGAPIEPNYKLVETLLAGIEERGSEIDARLDGALKQEWKRERMSKLLIAILQCAIFEMHFGKEISAKIVIDEYTRLTRSFFADDEVNFVHGALSKLADIPSPLWGRVREGGNGDTMDEFDLIHTYFAPLARGFPGSLNLGDDAAIISVPPDCELVVTTDAISQGVHFIGDEDASLIAKKLLRVNLSDLAAMGATPLCYFLALILPRDVKENWFKRFAAGLAQDQKEFHIHLAGGDTISTQGALSLSLTALGTVPKGKALKRSGAKVGDIVYVSGTLGDSALGLLSLRAQRSNPDWINDELINRYLLPKPRIALGQKLIGIANACMDISDGLVQDLGHICEASGISATIYRDKLPLSAPAKKGIKADQKFWGSVLSGGDDYELLFTASPEKESMIKKLAKDLNLPLTMIGKISKGKEVKVLDDAGKVLKIKRKGFQHF